MRAPPGVRTTLIAREPHTPYSGMLPGHIAGHYDYDQIHIDLGPLARAASARLVVDEVRGLDPDAGTIQLLDHPNFRFDVVSINSGATPGFGGVEVDDAVVPVKPIGRFLPLWNAIRGSTEQRLAAGIPVHMAIVGGGPGGVELALAIRHAIGAAEGLRLTVVTQSDELLSGHNLRVRRHFEALLARRGIGVERGFTVNRAVDRRLESAAGQRLAADEVFWVTGVQPADWPRRSGLAVDEDGFVRVDDCLRSTSHPNVFAAGDIAGMIEQPRPKSGVFAVRQGPVLADNLIRAVQGHRLRPYRAQTRALSLISEGGRVATASRGELFATGAWVWRWKDWIDRRFMRRFQDLPQMRPPEPRLAPALRADLPETMRCGGCGSKLGADLLIRVLRRLPVTSHPDVESVIGDDAAVLRGTGELVVVSVDSFRTMIDDPYLFGRIAAHHGLNDIFAMGAHPVAALAIVTVRLMAEALMEDELYLLMRGAVDVFAAHGVALAGGHSGEGAETSLGFAVTGTLFDAPLTKAGLAEGDALILTKPLGTGVLLAASMTGKARTRWVTAAVACMDESNGRAAEILRAHGVTGCTDVTGFGLLGHLAEMLRASRRTATVHVDNVPRLDGALDMLAAGEASSLQLNNEQVLGDCQFERCASAEPAVRVLVDPQTAGGLLAGVPHAAAEACLAALEAAGYRAAIVGAVGPDIEGAARRLRLVGT